MPSAPPFGRRFLFHQYALDVDAAPLQWLAHPPAQELPQSVADDRPHHQGDCESTNSILLGCHH